MTSLFDVPLDAAYHLVSGFTGFLTPVLGGVAAVAAIIVFTVAVRIILMPLSFRAMRGQAVQARLAPQLLALRKRYARQPEQLQREMAALYKREGTSMFAGITPLLLQLPLVSVIYLLFRSAQVGGKPNTLLGHDLLGVPLGAHWLSGAGPVSVQGLVFLGVFALLAGLCWLSARLGQAMTAQAAAASVQVAPGAASPVKAGPARRAAAKAGPADAAPAQAGALIKVLPYLTVLIAAFAPLAAGIYMLTSTGWSLAERRFFLRSSRGSAVAPRQPDASAVSRRRRDASGVSRRRPDASGVSRRRRDASGVSRRRPDASGVSRRQPDASGAGVSRRRPRVTSLQRARARRRQDAVLPSCWRPICDVDPALLETCREFLRWIRAWRCLRGTIVHLIDHGARIHRDLFAAEDVPADKDVISARSSRTGGEPCASIRSWISRSARPGSAARSSSARSQTSVYPT